MSEICSAYATFKKRDTDLEGVSWRIWVEEEVDISRLTRRIKVYGETSDGKNHILSDSEIFLYINGKYRAGKSRPSAYDKLENGKEENSHNLNGLLVSTTIYEDSEKLGNNLTLEIEFSGDTLRGLFSEVVLDIKTEGTCTLAGQFTPIDVSAPDIQKASLTSNRYGRDTTLYLNAQHTSYSMSAELVIDGLTKMQHDSHIAIEWEYNGLQIKALSAGQSSSGYKLCYQISNIPRAVNLYIPVNYISYEAIDEKYNTSGKSYPFKLTLTAENNKSSVYEGIMVVPQKVTGIECDSEISLNQSEIESVNYTVLPLNAQEQSVTFKSSDTEVAGIAPDGQITALNEGTCQITITTVDGGFSAFCTVTVSDKNSFPKLEQITYLSKNYVHKLKTACEYIRNELISKGINVSELKAITFLGNNHPITQIKPLLEAIEENCQIIRSALPYDETSFPAEPQTINKANINWWEVVNNWIAFLNEAHAKINGGD